MYSRDELTDFEASYMKTKRLPRKAVLVYQAGIANVFRVRSFNQADYGRDAERIMQHDFRTCENFARGLAYAGFAVTTMHCNQCGDIIKAKWSIDLEDAPFSDKFHPIDNLKKVGKK
jgi:hypothetical protein